MSLGFSLISQEGLLGKTLFFPLLMKPQPLSQLATLSNNNRYIYKLTLCDMTFCAKMSQETVQLKYKTVII
jgi:hypothetical protein